MMCSRGFARELERTVFQPVGDRGHLAASLLCSRPRIMRQTAFRRIPASSLYLVSLHMLG